MVKLEGIIYRTFDHYVVLRGFAPIKDLAAISHKPESYQRPAISSHKDDIIRFLGDNNNEYRYFPEITLACRVNNYEELLRSVGNANDVDWEDAKVIPGLKVLSQRLPFTGYRARHANLVKNNNRDIVRVDGNHRLESFDNEDDEVWFEYDIKELGKLIVPFTIIFSNADVADKFEAGIFHNINFKQEPLRLEASLRIIIDVDAFDDKEKLGKEYPLAIKLIRHIEKADFRSIPWLQNHNNIETDYYRTSCLRVIQLLQGQEIVIQKKKDEAEKLYKKSNNELKEKENSIRLIEEEIESLQKSLRQQEIEHFDFRLRSEYRETKVNLENVKNNKAILVRERNELKHSLHYYNFVVTKCANYLDSIKDVNYIGNVIYKLRSVYNEFSENQRGNIAFLCALVYYALLDEAQLNAFIKWAQMNGINQIVNPDDLSVDSSSNLINMFEQIYQSKKNEVFVSMQFGDSQSELIYEKVIRAIELFNQKHSGIRLNLHPIRIDRTIEQNTYSIQDKILEAIKNCSLIIADLSSHNINVYHEIGYAMGIAKSNKMLPNMILLYKENTDHNKDNTDVDKFIGFNLRNLSQLRFKDCDQLVEGLLKRLEKHYGV